MSKAARLSSWRCFYLSSERLCTDWWGFSGLDIPWLEWLSVFTDIPQILSCIAQCNSDPQSPQRQDELKIATLLEQRREAAFVWAGSLWFQWEYEICQCNFGELWPVSWLGWPVADCLVSAELSWEAPDYCSLLAVLDQTPFFNLSSGKE